MKASEAVLEFDLTESDIEELIVAARRLAKITKGVEPNEGLTDFERGVVNGLAALACSGLVSDRMWNVIAAVRGRKC